MKVNESAGREGVKGGGGAGQANVLRTPRDQSVTHEQARAALAVSTRSATRAAKAKGQQLLIHRAG